MRRYRVLAAISLLVLPGLLRGLWHYRGLYRPAEPVAVPSFSEIELPQPPLAGKAEAAQSEPDRQGKVVVIDRAHDNQFELPELEALTQILLAQGATLEVVTPGDEFESSSFGGSDALFAFSSRSLQTRLKYASAYVVVAPRSGFSEADIEYVTRFVRRGGRLLVVLDPTRGGGGVDIFGFVVSGSASDVSSANLLLESHDLTFSGDYLYNVLENEGNFRNVFLSPPESGYDFSQVALYAARSVATRGGSALLVGDDSTFSSRTDRGGGLSAAALSPDGRALALGDLTFLTSPYNRVADNAAFIRYLASFLLEGERQQDLTDLPYLFTRPVEVLTSADFAVQSETLGALRSLQVSLTSRGVPVTVTAEPSDGHDLLVMALYEPAEEALPFVSALDLTLPGDQEEGLLVVPGFGQLDPAGIGLLAAIQGPERTTLVMLAEDQDSLSRLAENVGQGMLSECVFQGEYALCRLGAGGGFQEGSDLDFGFDFNFEEPGAELPPTLTVPLSPTPTPAPAPTP
jgi:hypothetical protein